MVSGDYSISELQPGIERPWRFGSIKSCQMRCLYDDHQKKNTQAKQIETVVFDLR